MPQLEQRRLSVPKTGVAVTDGSVARPAARPSGAGPNREFLTMMINAAMDEDQDSIFDVVRLILAASVSDREIAETYVPEVARKLDEAWVKDSVDFVTVTMGCARLQRVLWFLETKQNGTPAQAPQQDASFLVGVPRGVQHVLGVSVLAGQLRSMGYGVHVDLELTPDSLASILEKKQLSGVLLSASGARSLGAVNDLVTRVKASNDNTPVIVGGAILEHVGDIAAHVPADLFTTSLDAVMAFCDPPSASQDETVKGEPAVEWFLT